MKINFFLVIEKICKILSYILFNLLDNVHDKFILHTYISKNLLLKEFLFKLIS